LRRRVTAVVAALGPALVALGQEPTAPAANERPWATVGAVALTAQSRSGREPWTPVASGAQLRQGDGLRTLDRCSAEARFDGGGRVLLAESTTLTLSAARAVALGAGQADVLVPVGAALLEVAAGRARLSVAAAEGPATVRVRLRDGAVQVMAFAGKARVEGVALLEVEAGFGVTLATRGATEPEKLLPAPLVSLPGPGAAPDHANPRFWWEDVPGAAGYTLDVCRDEACADVADRVASFRGAPWAPEGLPLGELYWRVSAVSPSGLDGVPSRPVRFTIRSLWRKPHPRPKSS